MNTVHIFFISHKLQARMLQHPLHLLMSPGSADLSWTGTFHLPLMILYLEMSALLNADPPQRNPSGVFWAFFMIWLLHWFSAGLTTVTACWLDYLPVSFSVYSWHKIPQHGSSLGFAGTITLLTHLSASIDCECLSESCSKSPVFLGLRFCCSKPTKRMMSSFYHFDISLGVYEHFKCSRWVLSAYWMCYNTGVRSLRYYNVILMWDRKVSQNVAISAFSNAWTILTSHPIAEFLLTVMIACVNSAFHTFKDSGDDSLVMCCAAETWDGDDWCSEDGTAAAGTC